MTENKCESCKYWSPTEACLLGHTESYDKSGCNEFEEIFPEPKEPNRRCEAC